MLLHRETMLGSKRKILLWRIVITTSKPIWRSPNRTIGLFFFCFYFSFFEWMSLFLRFHNQLDANKRFNSLKKLLHQEFNLINNHMYLIFFLFWGGGEVCGSKSWLSSIISGQSFSFYFRRQQQPLAPILSASEREMITTTTTKSRTKRRKQTNKKL